MNIYWLFPHYVIANLSTIILLLLLLSTSPSAGMKIKIRPQHHECFFEELKANQHLTITFYISDFNHGSDNLDFWVDGPHGRVYHQSVQQPSGEHTINAYNPGRYSYCFQNPLRMYTDEREVSWNLHGLGHEETEDEKEDPLFHEIRELQDAVDGIKDEQEYIITREKEHRNTAESTNTRVKWYSILHTACVIGFGLWQVYYTTSFFEARRGGV